MSEIKFNEEKIKTAVNEFNNWQGDAVIMCDTSDGAVWTDVFSGSTDWNEYHSKNIHELVSKRGINFRNTKVNVEAVNELLKAEAYKYNLIDGMPQEIAAIYMRHNL